MGTAVLAARVLLAGVFAVAGVGKLLDLPGSRRALADFGLRESFAPVAGSLLPCVELAIAVALVLRPSAVWSAVAALLLLVAFIAGIARALARGEQPDCHCFGQLHSAPANRGQIARNGGLAAVAAFVVAAGPGPAIDAWVAARTAAELVAALSAAAALLLAALSFSFWRSLRQPRAGGPEEAVSHGLPIGSLAPSFSTPGLDGERFTLEQLLARGRPVALVFGEPGCGPCAGVAPEIDRWQRTLAGALTIAPVGIGTYLRYEEVAARTGVLTKELYERDQGFAREVDELNALLALYRVHATPSAVILTAGGTVASVTVDGRLAVEALLHLAVARRGAVGLAVGQAVAA
jgi:thiol-disulfide isomerase/thioredoxin